MKTLVLLVGLMAAITGSAGEYNGVFIGRIWQYFDYPVDGEVYAIGESKIRIIDFTFDGQGRNALFYSGTQHYPGQPMADEQGSLNPLRKYTGETIDLALPQGQTVVDMKWLTIWCQDCEVNEEYFGIAYNNGKGVAPMNIGQFITRAHQVSSGSVTIRDSITMEIKNFNYDGYGPDAFFILGVDKGRIGTDNYIKIPDHLGRLPQKYRYVNEDITLTLPSGTKFEDYEYLALYCISFSQNFGEVEIPMEPTWPPVLRAITTTTTTTTTATSTTTTTPTTTTEASRAIPGEDGFSELGNCEQLNEDFTIAWETNNTHIVLELKSFMGSRDYMAFGLSGSSFASQMVGSDVIVAYYGTNSQPMADDYYLSQKSECFNGVGACPDTRSGSFQNVDLITGSRINDIVKVRVVRKLQTDDYSGKDKAYSITQPQYIVWALGSLNSQDLVTRHHTRGVNKQISFGRDHQNNCADHMGGPDVSVGGGTEQATPTPETSQAIPGEDGSSVLGNCEQLNADFQIAWDTNNTHIVMELKSTMENRDYMAFGLSGQTSASRMIGADVIVAYYDSSSRAMAVDYNLNQYALCSNGSGACPDSFQNVKVITGSRESGIVRVRVERKLQTDDYSGQDKAYSITQSQYIVWALGGLNQQNLVTKHDTRLRGDKQIFFGRAHQNSCGDLMGGPDVGQTPGWTEQVIYGYPNNQTVFEVTMGPSGGDKGYKAITGHQSWGIAFYINGQLIPKLVLQRGITYTFIVKTGYNPDNTAEYHPFYITNDPLGGYAIQTPEQRESFVYYAGIGSNGQPTHAGNGDYCEYRLQDPNNDPLPNAGTFTEFSQGLYLSCSNGELKFTPDHNTPHLIYYQCYTHNHLGWKIVVVDSIE